MRHCAPGRSRFFYRPVQGFRASTGSAADRRRLTLLLKQKGPERFSVPAFDFCPLWCGGLVRAASRRLLAARGAPPLMHDAGHGQGPLAGVRAAAPRPRPHLLIRAEEQAEQRDGAPCELDRCPD